MNVLKTNQELHVSVYLCVSLHLFSSLPLSLFTTPSLFSFSFSHHVNLSHTVLCSILHLCFPRLVPFLHYPVCDTAVQEERQRNKEREGEVESTSAANEEMPVEKILEAEMAVEQKTELHADGSSGGSSVSNR